MASRSYQVGPSSVTIIFGDILKSSAEVLVSSDDYLLTMGGGVSQALRIAGGHDVVRDVKKMIPRDAGDVVVTTAGNLPARYIAHAISIGRQRPGSGSGTTSADSAAVVRTATRRAMELLPALGCSSIAFPAIGTGVAGVDPQTSATEMAVTIVDALLDSSETIDVELWLWDTFRGRAAEPFFNSFEDAVGRHFLLSTGRAEGQVALRSPADPLPGTTAGDVRREEIYTLLRHLDGRRKELESQLVEALRRSQPIGDVRRQLQQVADLRASYTSEVAETPAHGDGPKTSVFVSSTSRDLVDYRNTVRMVIGRLGLGFVGMEEFKAESHAPAEVIRQRVKDSGVYLGILGTRYGHVDPATGFSMTELEYNQAVASDKQLHIFVMDESATVSVNMIERDPDKVRKLNEFRDRVMAQHTCALFTDTKDLGTKVERSLSS